MARAPASSASRCLPQAKLPLGGGALRESGGSVARHVEYPQIAPPVVALYPKEGTFWSDHRCAILNAPWVEAEQRAAAEIFRDFLLARPQQELCSSSAFGLAIQTSRSAHRSTRPERRRSAAAADAARCAWRRRDRGRARPWGARTKSMGM